MSLKNAIKDTEPFRSLRTLRTVLSCSKISRGDVRPYSLTRSDEQLSRAESRDAVVLPFEPRIFMLWFSGLGDAPPIVRASFESWRAANPDFEVVFLDNANLRTRIETDDLPRKLTPQERSDVIRLRLLLRHGGVWADATTIAMRPLSGWLGRFMQAGFFAFSAIDRDRIVSSWFLASVPGSPLARGWADVYERYLRMPVFRQRPYFAVHYTFDHLLRSRPDLAAQWREREALSADGTHILKFMLTQPAEIVTRPEPAALARVPLFKLSWKDPRESVDTALAKLSEFGLTPPGLERWGRAEAA